MKTRKLVGLIVVISLIALLVIVCLKNCETYANQVIHGSVGGIAGPSLDPSFFETSPQQREEDMREFSEYIYTPIDEHLA